MTRLKVSGFIVVDCSYETEVDVPEEYAGREIEYLQEHGLLLGLNVGPGGELRFDLSCVPGLARRGHRSLKWDIKPDSFKPAVAEVITDIDAYQSGINEPIVMLSSLRAAIRDEDSAAIAMAIDEIALERWSVIMTAWLMIGAMRGQGFEFADVAALALRGATE